MPECKKCGFELPENTYYCPKCATPTEKLDEVKKPKRIAHFIMSRVVCTLAVLYFLYSAVDYGVQFYKLAQFFLGLKERDPSYVPPEEICIFFVVMIVVSLIAMIFSLRVKKKVSRFKKRSAVWCFIMFALPTLLVVGHNLYINNNGMLLRSSTLNPNGYLNSAPLQLLDGGAFALVFSIVGCLVSIAYFIWKRKTYRF